MIRIHKCVCFFCCLFILFFLTQEQTLYLWHRVMFPGQLTGKSHMVHHVYSPDCKNEKLRSNAKLLTMEIHITQYSSTWVICSTGHPFISFLFTTLQIVDFENEAWLRELTTGAFSAQSSTGSNLNTACVNAPVVPTRHMLLI